MRLTKISADVNELVFSISDGGTRVCVREYVPVPGGRLLSETEAEVQNGEVRIPRFDGARDRLTARFDLGMDGVRFVSDLLPGASLCSDAYPQPACIKALGGTDEDVRALGLHQTLYNINLPAIMTTHAGADTIPFAASNGKTYHFLRVRVESIDGFMKHADEMGLLVTMILLNSPRLFGSAGEEELLKRVIHPRYEWNARDAFLSAFNMEEEEGQGYYCAFVEFLAARYTRPDRRYGRALGAIISNEVDSQCVWSNAGEMDVDTFTREYATACRLAWLLGRKHYANFRVYISLDQYFSARYRPLEPLHTYPGREIIDRLNDCCLQDGNFGWAVAYHPYPEDLRYPDFWNDRAPDFTFSTPKITFKNMEVLPAYLAQTRLLYEGQPRRIIFSEQGFNSQSGALRDFTEAQAAAAYCLAYMKARAIETCDLFTHHAYVDNPHEFGLNLGIRRYDPDAPAHAGEKKPIYDSVRDMDTEREAERVAQARAFIGEALFDYLLNPPVVHGDNPDDTAVDFG